MTDAQAFAAAWHAQRAAKDRWFRFSDDSPLTPAQRDAFTGLCYYPPDPALDLVLVGEPLPADDAGSILIETTKRELRRYQRVARVRFTVDGQSVTLTIYETPHGCFLPFVDAGAGTATYPAGRYLDPERLPDGRFVISFNAAYNPFCAYNDRWSCAITPPENRLHVAIRAGEKLPVGSWLAAAGTES